jgi:hypothetical protein
MGRMKEFDQSQGPSLIFSQVVPCVSKYIKIVKSFSEEVAIMRSQHLELICSQSGMLYEILLDAPWSMFNKTKQNYGLHVDEIVGSSQRNSTY